MNNPYLSPFARPIYVMLKPVGSVCNLACDYCYYLEKSKFYPEVKNHILSDELLEKFIREYLECQTIPEVLFTWHGGETLMRPISFYKKALELQRKYARGRRIDNCIQTNGTLLTDDWCRFFRENNFLVGVSIDGPQEFHDEYRRNRQGLPSFYKVMKGIELLKKHGVEYNAMAVVNDYNVDYPLEFYRFFKEIGCHYIQFAPIVERLGRHADGTRLAAPGENARPQSPAGTQRPGEKLSDEMPPGEMPQNEKLPDEKPAPQSPAAVDGSGMARTGQATPAAEAPALAPFSVDPVKWGRFLCALFDEWLKEDVGTYYIQLFDATLANWVGEQPGVCSMAPTCGHAGVMEFNGDVYACDHYVFPAYKLGNIRTHTLTEMMYSPRQLQFGADKRDKLPDQCKACDYLFACNGECPKNRFAYTADGQPGLNYLCAGYRHFFSHVAPYMDFMKKELLAQRPPANVMEWARGRAQ